MCLPILVLKIVRRVVTLAMAAAIVYLGVTLYQVYHEAFTAMPVHSQAIVVMGTAEYNGVPSRDLAARLNEADALFKEKYAPVIYLTGGSSPGDKFTEAGVGVTYLSNKGVPAASLVADPVGRDTWESLTAVAKALSAHKIHSIIIVSDGFHLLRCTQMMTSLGFKTSAAASANSPVKGAQLAIDYGRETLAVGAARIVGYKFLSIVRHGS
jgi:uncharacterized SAM-binding protein YcdF (DUF218 family)